MNAPIKTIAVAGAPPVDLRAHYEKVVLDTTLLLWRHRSTITRTVIAAMLIAVVALILLPRRYTAEAVIQLDFAREEAARVSSVATVEAAAMVESEARILRSRSIARAVAVRPGIAAETLVQPSSNPLTRLISTARSLLMPETLVADPIEEAAIKLSRRLVVTNVPRAYLINVDFTSSTPEHAAAVANAFAQEFFRSKSMQSLNGYEAAAQREVQKLAALYGESHPALVAARSNLDAAHRQREALAADTLPPAGFALTPAEANATPSFPNGRTILGMTLFSSILAGIGLALLAEKLNSGFRTSAEVEAATGVACVGLLPRRRERARGRQRAEFNRQMRAICQRIGLIGDDERPRIVLLTGSGQASAVTAFADGLAEALTANGLRVLAIDTTGGQDRPGAIDLADALASVEELHAFLDGHRDDRLTRCACGGELAGESDPAFRDLGRLLEAARDSYDVVVLEASTVSSCSDPIFLGRLSECCLLVEAALRSSQQDCSTAVARLAEAGVAVHGIVLTDCDATAAFPFADGDLVPLFRRHLMARTSRIKQGVIAKRERAAARRESERERKPNVQPVEQTGEAADSRELSGQRL